MTDMNSHYVTRGLTRPWEVEDRKLWFYDFETGEIDKKPSRYLFSDFGLIPREYDSKFNTLIEDPLVGLRTKIQNNPSHSFSYKEFKAAILYFSAQTLRYGSLISKNKGEDDNSLVDFLSKDNKFYDELVVAWQTKYKLVAISVVEGQKLYFPQVGFYSFSFFSENEFYDYGIGYAVPLNVDWCLAIVPVDTLIEDLESQRLVMMAFSTGLNEHCKRLIIPPIAKEHNGDEIIIEDIVEKREKSIKMMNQFSEMRGLVNEMYATFGIPVQDVISEHKEKIDNKKDDESDNE
jgi:hypothetical protein